MTCKLKGETVTLIKKTASGTDSFNRTSYTETRVKVENVLIGQPTSDDITASTQMYGKKLAYILAIPKGDTNDWEDTEVEFFGKRFRTYGYTVIGIEANISRNIPWHKKVMVEMYG